MASISWLRRFPKARVYILSATLLLSIILIGFGYIYGQNVETAPVRDTLKFNQTQLIFYLTTMPSISIIHTIAEFLFFIFSCGWWSALPQLILSVILAVGWLTQASFWMDCEVVLPNNDSVPRYCPQFPLKNGGTDRYGGEAVAKNVMIWVLFLFYVVNTIMVAISFRYRERKAQGSSSQPEQEAGEAFSEHFSSYAKGMSFARVEDVMYPGWDQCQNVS